MRNRSAAVLEPAPGLLVRVENPEGDFTAIYVKGPAKFTGRVSIDTIDIVTAGRLSQQTPRMFVMVSGTITDVRLFGDENANHPHPHAVVVLDSGTGAELVVDVVKHKYDLVWGDLVIGRTVRISGTIQRTLPLAPTILRLSRITALEAVTR